MTDQPTGAGRHDVDLAEDHGSLLFYFVSDELYEKLPAAKKRRDPYPILKEAKEGRFPAARCNARRLEDITSSRFMVEAMIQWFWGRDENLAVWDVGSHAGRFAVDMGNYIRDSGKKTPVLAFEPGRTFELIERSVALNGLQGRVTVLNSALTDVDGPLLFAESAEQTNTSSIWRKSYHDRTVIADSISLETVLAKHNNASSIIMKLDVEGGEPMILSELDRINDRPHILPICEIVPWRFNGPAGAADYLRVLLERYHLVNIAAFLYDYRHAIVVADDINALMENVAKKPSGFTDMLLIPRNLPSADDLLSVLRQLKPEQ